MNSIDDFYDVIDDANHNLRSRVVAFMEQHPTYDKYKNEKWYELEDAFVDFVRQNEEYLCTALTEKLKRDKEISND